MGIHSKQVGKTGAIRVAGYKIFQHFDHVELMPSYWNKNWPKLASRFESLGALRGLETGAQGTKMIVDLDVRVIEGMISGRRLKRRFPRLIGFGLLVPVLVFASLLPLKNGIPERRPDKAALSANQSCSLDAVGRWLRGLGESEDIKMLGTSVLGGVTAGTLECKGTRYSYTLGSEEPKRVMKLQKLDS